MAKHRTLNAEGLAAICSDIKENRAAAASAGTAVATLSEAVQRGFKELTDAINDFPRATPFAIPATASETAWILDNEETSDYKWHYDIAAADVSTADVAIVTVSRSGAEAARRCGLCPQNETLAGKIRIRAMSVPPQSIAAEYYVCPGKEDENEEGAT